MESAKKGGLVRKNERIEKTRLIREKSSKEIGTLSKREKFLIGIALYWAEGAKEKTYRTGSRVDLSNSDPKMIQFFLSWLTDICNIDKKDIKLSLYIHENNKFRLKEVISHWSKMTKYPEADFKYVYFKKHNPKTVRKNIGEGYFGNLRIVISESADFNRKISGWIEGINK